MLTRFSSIFLLLSFFPLSGCLYGDQEGMAMDAFSRNARKYCETKNHFSCLAYSTCYKNVYSKNFKRNSADVALMDWAMPEKPHKENEFGERDYSSMMENINNKMLEAENNNHHHLSVSYAYMLYAHNDCAIIIGDKKYDISLYEKEIQDEININK